MGFAFALMILGTIRELLGSYSFFGFQLIKADGILVFVLAPGAFIALGFIIALINNLRKTK